jgi:hypothetical protein
VLAHIVAPSDIPVWATWLASLAMFGGALGAVVWWRERPRRIACTALGGAGLAASAALLLLQPSVVQGPGYGIRLVSAQPSTSPVLLRICGGGGAPVPGPGRLVLVSVDGRQAAEVRTDTVVLPIAHGTHTVAAELLTSNHRAFTPPVTARTTVNVNAAGPLPTPPACG